ncbi:hypothetical protein JW930_00080 [Candidatus Woesearchaeota archaeon]|nr:hypothetical protein [Candidatus Woesearchaeota archaeon]
MRASKRGSMTLWTLVDLFMLAVIVLAFLFQIWLISQSTLFERRFLARDMALLIDTVYASPNNLDIRYPQNTLWFSLLFENSKVSVTDKRKEDLPLSASYYFTEDTSINFVYKQLDPIAMVQDEFPSVIIQGGEGQIQDLFVPLVISRRNSYIEPQIKIAVEAT